MRFNNRSNVEEIGLSGVRVEKDELGTRARQLNSFWLYVDPEDEGYTKHALSDGYWEAWITLWMDRNIKPGFRCLDVGANHGYYSFMLASMGCNVFAVEPQPKLAALIIASEQVNKLGVKVIDAALCDKDDELIEMMVPIHHGMNATISSQNSYAPDGYETIRVNTFSLDSQIGFDFIKVDAEGAEDLIWAGSEKYRKENPNTLWLMEWRWDRYKKPKQFAQELLKGYSVSHVDFDGNEEPVTSVQQLATRKNSDWMLVLRHR